MTALFRNFGGTILFTVAGLALAAAYGWYAHQSVAGMADVVWIVMVLAVLEVSLSFDNAVVNAAVLKGMEPVWRKRFLTWGMAIAVFGMRIVFPLLIVALAAGIGPIEALDLSLRDPDRYQEILTGAHVTIAGFGGAFLLMVGLDFFLDCDKDVHWIKLLEVWLARFGSVAAMAITLVLIILLLVSRALPAEEQVTFLVSGLCGLIAHTAMEAVTAMLGDGEESEGAAAGKVVRTGLAGFLYLNLLDASFSFDGVIGAFALTNAMPVIAIGLSIGAMAVRSLTLLMVERDTLAEYRYLEHGAFWAIIALGVLMMVSAIREVPEALTGLIGAVLIGLSLAWSVRYRRRHPV